MSATPVVEPEVARFLGELAQRLHDHYPDDQIQVALDAEDCDLLNIRVEATLTTPDPVVSSFVLSFLVSRAVLANAEGWLARSVAERVSRVREERRTYRPTGDGAVLPAWFVNP